MGQRHGPAGVVPLVHAVGGRRLVLSADGLVGAAGDGVWHGGGGGQRVEGVVSCIQLGARRLRHAAATEGRDAAAVRAREHRGAGHQAGGLALSGRGGEGRHCGLLRRSGSGDGRLRPHVFSRGS